MSKLRKAAARALPRKYKNKLRNAVHPAQRLALARMLTRGESDVGLLSVVIPAYNVAEYIAECLTSVISQSYTNLEIIVVDDGSTDASMQIVAGFAKYDKRISVIQLENGGNGRARNIGINVAKGEYLTFADSDDVVAPGAYALMMAAIKTSGSDFVVGSSMRLIGKKLQSTKISSHMHAKERTGISINDFPDILDDVFLWNKVFKKSFWDAQVAPIPEGVLYEDQETTARAFVRAHSFDVLEEIVYFWRQRSDESSITQGKRSQKDLEDRITVAHRVSSLVAMESSPQVFDKWCIRLLGSDLVPYYEQVPYTPNEYWSTLNTGVESLSSVLLQCIDADRLGTKIEPHARVLFGLALAGLKDELEQVIVDRIETGTGFRVETQDSKFYAVPNYAVKLPGQAGPRRLECVPDLLQLDTQVRVRGWTANGDLALSGHAFVRGLGDDLTYLQISALPLSNGTTWTVLNTDRANNEHLDAGTNDPFASHGGSAFRLEVPADLLPKAHEEALSVRISLTVAGHTFTETHSIGMPGRVSTKRSTNATVRVVGYDANPEFEEFSIDVSWGAGSARQGLFLATRQHRIDPVTTSELGANVVRYVFRLSGVAWDRTVQAPPSGAYTLRYRSQDDVPSTSPGKPVVAAETLQWDLPRNQQLTHANVQAWATSNGNFAITVGPPLDADERGRYRQRELQQTFLSVHDRISRHIIFESFGGKSCTDSPRALSDQLHLENPSLTIYWSIVDYSVSYPNYASPLIRGSKAWFEKIQTAQYLVNNNNFPFYFHKKKGQYYLQTWHGTPMKKIGLDAPTRYLSPSYRRLMDREAAYWDALLAQNDFSRRVLPKAFGYKGKVLSLGYPRNDTLAGAGAGDAARSVRSLLGIADGQLAVLYAPTWRDHVKDSGGGHRWVGHLDFESARRDLGDGVVFLVRGHHNLQGLSADKLAANVIDVSGYQEINDLILASDVLITDYSSLMFDYSVTGKLILFLVADLMEYQSDTRGLYLSHSEIGMGNTFSNGSEVVEALKAISPGSHSYSPPSRKYSSRDDGYSSIRVLDALGLRAGDDS